MRHLFFFLAGFLICLLTKGQSTTFLRINPNGHMGQIRDLVISADKRYVITASFDKTVKKWDIETGRIVMEYRSHIGRGSEGMVYKIALSSDNKYIATMGWFGSHDESENLGDVRLFDYHTGKLVRVFKGHEGTPKGCGFSVDNKYLIVGDENSNIYKWDVATGEKVASYVFHSKTYEKTLHYLVCNHDRILGADWQGYVSFWDINNATKPLALDKKLIKKAFYNDIGPLAISPNQKEVVIALNHFMFFLNEKLKFKYYIKRDNISNPGFMKYSPDGEILLTGSVTRGKDNRYCIVYKKNAASGKFEIWATYRGHHNSAIAGEIIDNSTFVTGGGEFDEIHVWKVLPSGETQLVSELKGVGITHYATSLTHQTIGFTNIWTQNLGKSTLLQTFDLFLKEFRPLSEEDDFNSPLHEWKNYSLDILNTGVTNNVFSGLIVKRNNKNIDTIFRENWNGESHDAFTFSPEGFVISGGSYGILEAFSKEGVIKNHFIGHEGDIWGCSISKDGKRLITCSNDKTIRIWPLDKLGIKNPIPPSLSVREKMKELDVDLDQTAFKKIFTQLGIYPLADERTYHAWETIITKLKEGNWPHTFLQNVLNDYKTTNIYPVVSIFVSESGEWIIWNEEGYFTSSKNGAQYVGYHINQGKDKEAKFYPFEQFDLKYNRPDIILKNLEIGHDGIIDFYYQSYLKRLKKHGLKIEDLQQDIHAPELTIVNYSAAQKNDLATVQIKAKDSKYQLDRIVVFINGVPIFGKTGMAIPASQNVNKTLEIELAKGKNNIEISVYNEKGTESLREYLVIENGTPVEKPNLYLVAIGTSQYKNQKFNLKYAAKDAQDLAKTFGTDPMYAQVYTRVMVDKEVTSANIAQLKNFLGGATRNDVVMVFVAGHGLLDENFDYYYAAHDVDFNNPRNNGIPYEQIENLLEGIRALKKLLIMDTCHSGELDAEEVELAVANETEMGDVLFRNVGFGVRQKQGKGLVNTSEMVKELFVDLRKGTGATVISSSGGAEFSMESDQWKNGLFTYCLISGLTTKKADLNNDGSIVLSELKEYVQQNVKELSRGKQTPTSRIENLAVDYVIWR
jgi:WD40 repeat protein